jgi:iron complex outermembrane recepter protein
MMGSRTFKSVLAGSVCALALSTVAMAQETAKTFDVPAGDLAPALDAYIKQSGEQLIYRVADVRGMKTPGVRGALSSDEALQQLLAGTALKIQRDPSGLIAIASIADPQSSGAAGDGAEGTVQALIVTAQKREENIQDVPIAMSAFTQEDLTRSQVAGGPDLMTQVPNFTFTKTNFSGYSIQIRGIGTQAISATVDPAVAVAFNNTPFIRNRFFEQEFYDLERVEVLRGPQGTLYGRNATAGVVNLISAKPNYSEFQAKASGDISNYSSRRLEGMINIPLVDGKAALRLAGAWTKRDGFVKNTVSGEQTDGRDLWSGRATLGLEPTSWFKANLIYEHFSENDDRLRSGKQLCHTDPDPAEVGGVPINYTADIFTGNAYFWTQGCNPASLYSPDSYQTPNGWALPYGPEAAQIGAPINIAADPYASTVQSRNLREIETRVKPEYTASNDTVELQLQFELPHDLTLTSETGFNHDTIFSFEDFNRFNTRSGVFLGASGAPNAGLPAGEGVDANGFVCNPQLGCSDRMAAGDLSTAKSLQFSQEFRVSSNFDGKFNFSVGGNFLRYDTEDKYYVFFNTLDIPAKHCHLGDGSNNNPYVYYSDPLFYSGNGADNNGYAWSSPTHSYGTAGIACAYYDSNNIHNLNDEGRNYFLSKNPYHLLSYAAFGEIYYQITPDLKLTGGFRWTDDQKQAPQIPTWLLAAASYGMPTLKVIEQEWKEPTGRFAIDWRPKLDITDETLLYASYTHGYKAGGANPPSYIVTNVPLNIPWDFAQKASLSHPATFTPEFVNAFEVGTKNTLLDGRLTLNLNAFYYDYTGYQISQIVDRSAINLNFDAKIWGSELETDWRPLQNLRLGFKLGYENTRMAKGSQAIDLIDRTAGHPGWLVRKPFPTIASNCIVPLDHTDFDCIGYELPTPPPFVAPNNGEGFAKDLSGNELPNAPHFTATLTVDYTIPLPHDWLVTLHTDLYGQAEAWARVFNTPGYDRLKAYNNVNFAAIFSNEDAGWQVMAYVKNVLNKDNITGAFLNSDDTGLTTNVFLNEPRLYGVRLTKSFDGQARLESWFGEHKAGSPYPFRLELDGYYGRFSQNHERFSPPIDNLFNSSFPSHDDAQRDLDWGAGGGGKLTYGIGQGRWNISAAIRYGRALGQTEAHAKQALPDFCVTLGPNYGCYNPTELHGKYNFYDAIAHNGESHAIADFMVGREFGIGSRSRRPVTSEVSLGLGYVELRSSADLVLHDRPDYYFPANETYPDITYSHVHHLNAEMQADRKFKGAGPAMAWNGAMALAGNADAVGRVDLTAGLGGSILFGRQKTRVHEHEMGVYSGGPLGQISKYVLPSPYNTAQDHLRTKSATVPGLNASLGLSYELGRMKLDGGYRWERYFKAIDAGLETRKTYDRSFDGPYFKVSVGFGG